MTETASPLGATAMSELPGKFTDWERFSAGFHVRAAWALVADISDTVSATAPMMRQVRAPTRGAANMLGLIKEASIAGGAT